MCAGAAVLARVDRIVFGAWEPRTGAVGSLWDVVRDRRLNHRPEVLGGVLEDPVRGVMVDLARSSARGQRPVILTAVACPSGQRSAPRKRVWVLPTVGSNPTATTMWCLKTSA